jgi:hypothetical protein
MNFKKWREKIDGGEKKKNYFQTAVIVATRTTP